MGRTKKAFLIGTKNKDKFLKETYEYMFPDVSFFTKNIKSGKIFDDFLLERDFFFVVVDHPYKTKIIDYLDKVSPGVKKSGSCNFVLNKGGILVGYNTEVEAIKKTIENHGLDCFMKTVGIIGKGTETPSLKLALEEFGASIVELYRKNEAVSSLNVEVVFNALPIQKDKEDIITEISKSKTIKTYINLYGQDFRTREMSYLKEKGIGIVGSVDFLIETAKLNRLIVSRILVPSKIVKLLKEDVLTRRVNLIVVSLPTTEKDEMAREFRKLLNEPKDSTTGAFISTDLLIERVTHKKIKRILDEKFGDELYRSFDASIAKEIEFTEGRVVFVGHETLLDEENYYRLSKNGLIIYLKKTDFGDFKEDKKSFVKSQEMLKRMYKANNPIYERRADLTIVKPKDALSVVKSACEVLSNE